MFSLDTVPFSINRTESLSEWLILHRKVLNHEENHQFACSINCIRIT